jgi:uncharacterized membrane protein YphA (DoxX/SURF4 family)
MAKLEGFRKIVYQSAGLKTAISILLTVSGGFFTSTLSTEIAGPAGIAWGTAHTTSSFWLLLLICLATYLFHRNMHLHERSIQAFQDAEYCLAYVRSQLIPSQVEAYKKEIESGNLAQFEEAMSKMKDSLK